MPDRKRESQIDRSRRRRDADLVSAAELELNAREDDTLMEDLQASVSQYVGTCESSKQMVILSYHEIVLAERALREYNTSRRMKRILREVRRARIAAKEEHVRHEERGTCILERPKKEW